MGVKGQNNFKNWFGFGESFYNSIPGNQIKRKHNIHVKNVEIQNRVETYHVIMIIKSTLDTFEGLDTLYKMDCIQKKIWISHPVPLFSNIFINYF